LRESQILDADFFGRDTVEVARDLLGCVLCRRVTPRRVIRVRITEAEAYDGFEDRASHAHAGRTARTEVMFGPPGRWYVYLCYGVHWMLNIVTRESDYPAAVLLRGSDEVYGPGRLTRLLQVNLDFNRLPAIPASNLWIERGEPIPMGRIECHPRIGVAYAGPYWSQLPWRFTWVK